MFLLFTEQFPIYAESFKSVIAKTDLDNVELQYDLPEVLSAPIAKNASVGRIVYKINGEQIGFSNVYAGDDCEKIEFWDILFRIFEKIFIG